MLQMDRGEGWERGGATRVNDRPPAAARCTWFAHHEEAVSARAPGMPRVPLRLALTLEPLQDGQGFATALGLTVGPRIIATHLTIPSKHPHDSEVWGFLQQLVLCAKS